MEYVALVTLLLLMQYMFFTMMVGKARMDGKVMAPAVIGDETFERAYRVQMNTLEQLLITMPALWISGYYFDPLWAAALGLVFFLGRALYRTGYMDDPEKRGPGMAVGFLANIGLILAGLWGVAGQVF